MSDVVWNVDGQRGDLGLHRLHRGLWSFTLHLLPGGQGRECDLDVCAGEPERAPAKEKTNTRLTKRCFEGNQISLYLITTRRLQLRWNRLPTD